MVFQIVSFGRIRSRKYFKAFALKIQISFLIRTDV